MTILATTQSVTSPRTPTGPDSPSEGVTTASTIKPASQDSQAGETTTVRDRKPSIAKRSEEVSFNEDAGFEVAERLRDDCQSEARRVCEAFKNADVLFARTPNHE